MPNQTVLIVDDEDHIRHIVAHKMRGAGLNVVECRDGEEALAAATQSPPDLVITDLQMPYMSGLDLCMALKNQESTSHVPAIMLTARGHILDAADLAKTNIRELMAKPFGARNLLDRALEVLQEGGKGSARAAA